MKDTIIAIAMAAMLPLAAVAQLGTGTATPLNDGWLFSLSDDSSYCSPTYDDSQWRSVQLPHDWGVELPMSEQNGSCQGYLPGGIGWYRLHVKGDGASDVCRLLYFEGIYNRATIYVNGHEMPTYQSGYAPQVVDFSMWENRSAGADNVIAVRVDHSRQNDSRWYTGSGINRPVWLVSTKPIHFEPFGTAWSVASVDEQQAVIDVSLNTTDASSGRQAAGKHSLQAEVSIIDTDGQTVATTTKNISLAQRDTLQLTVSAPRLWSLDSPYLYIIRARLRELSEGTTYDETTVPLGIRTLNFDPDRGFALNGEWMKVKGVCVHDDAGVLGTAVPKAVWRRRLLALKGLGVNAIRMSHNPHATAVYDLCDELGLLVMDEASDEWELPKRKWLEGWNKGTPGYEGSYELFSELETDVELMVRRNRIHPSIFMWSIGNEVDYPNDPYSHPVLDGSSITQPMYGGYKPEQPHASRLGEIAAVLAAAVRSNDTSRPVTAALAGVVMSNETAYPDALDVVGYNYTESRYTEDHQRYPTRVIYGSENRHDREAWLAVRDNPHIFGQFLWTGIDYLGESGPWPARGSEAGLLDLAGRVKPQGEYRKMLWSDLPTDSVERSMRQRWQRRGGRQERGSDDRQEARPTAVAMRISVDTVQLRTIDDAAHIDIELVDSAGQVVPFASNDITCTITGPARLLGLENGNARDTCLATLNHRQAFRGRLLAYIGRDFAQPLSGAATAHIKLASPELGEAEVELQILP